MPIPVSSESSSSSSSSSFRLRLRGGGSSSVFVLIPVLVCILPVLILALAPAFALVPFALRSACSRSLHFLTVSESSARMRLYRATLVAKNAARSAADGGGR